MKHTLRVKRWGVLLWCLLVLPLRLGWAGNTHQATGDAALEQRAWWGDVGTSYVHTGCTHGVSGTTSASIPACRAYARNTVAPQQLEYIEDLSARTVTYTGGAGTYWLIAHASTTEPVSGWTRASVTHYLWQRNTVQPALPNRATWLLQVTVVDSAITRVDDLRARAPIPTAAQTNNAVWNAAQHGVTCDGVTNNTRAIQRLIEAAAAAGGGVVQLPPGTCMTDRLYLRSYVELAGRGAGVTTLAALPHTTTHNPVILIGDSGTVGVGSPSGLGYGRILRARVRHLTIDGNSAQQTGAGDEFSPCIWIWGSEETLIEQTELTDCKGDGITLGYGLGRIEGADRNLIRHNELHGNFRHPLALTFGNENVIEGNKATGTFDLELDPAVASTLKKNIVQGNTGRTGGSSTSDLIISLASLNTDVTVYFGNIITNNVVSQINGQYNSHTVITGNVIVGSGDAAYQVRLMALDEFRNAVICNNIFLANQAVATGLTHVLRTRGGSGIVVCNNVVENGTLPFADYIATFGTSPAARAHSFHGNVLMGTGTYRVGGEGPERPSEAALIRLSTNGGSPQTLTAQQLTGSPLIPGNGVCTGTLPFVCGHFVFSLSGVNLIFGFESGGGKWLLEPLPYGSAGTQSEPYNQVIMMNIDELGSNKILSPFYAPIGGTLAFNQYFFSAGGTVGTLFVRVTY